MSARDARLRLVETLCAIPGLAVVVDPGQTVDPPAIVMVPPKLTYDAYAPSPTEAEFQVPLVVRQDESAMDRLDELLELIEVAVYDSEDAALTGAQAGNWGTPPLPCYLLTIEVSV